MATTPVKLPIHHHPLFPYVGFSILERCAGCLENFARTYGGYYCNEPLCYVWFHKDCAKAPLVINHLSHPQHRLRLTNDSGDGSCDLCGQKLLHFFYNCPTCEFKLDFLCGIKPSPPAIEHPLCHDHPLVFLKIRKEEEEVPCELCKDSIGGPSYSCLKCKMYFHVDCVQLSKEISHPCHSNHPLKLITFESLTHDAEKICISCREQPKYVVYHCSICNFTTCIKCTKNPPPLVVEHTKTHMHPLTLFSTRISFTCRICGEEDTKEFDFNMPYICFQCNFVIHGKCIDLPRVININRHKHRISFTGLILGAGYSNCGVCRKYISQYYGAYSCSFCPNYAVHPRCAMQNYIWDLKELEGIPDEAEDIIAPFKEVGDNLICHFSHEEHPLHKEDTINDEHKRCKACCHPVGFGSIYVCEECGFFLHEKCANLPMKTKFGFSVYPYTLEVAWRINYCNFCGIFSDGFEYTAQGRGGIDVHCGSLSEPLLHDGHGHPLYFYQLTRNHCCNGCYKDIDSYVMLHCDDCDFDLCFSCASLPEKIWYRNDEHPLTLCCVEKESIKNNWCDNCEREIEAPKWFYRCSDCGVNVHVQCVLGDFSRLMPGRIFEIDDGRQYEVVLNNQNTRPSCSYCHSRCKALVILKDRNEDYGYICSFSCFQVPFESKKH